MRKRLSLFVILILYSVFLSAQTKNVTGKVTDQQGQPVPFASVRIKGSKQGVSADADGNFSIKVAKSSTLIVSGSGLTEKEIEVSPNSAAINVQVDRNKGSNLSEVVVTALGVQRQAKELGYSTAKVSGKDVTQAKPISAINGLTGKVSGLQINTVNNGLFAQTRVTLRGIRSLTGNNQPLYVVDGSIFYNDISTLNADDITDVTVLKGSSASAVYGSDASNGVILITTKKGTRAKPIVSFSETVQSETVAYMPAFQSRFGQNGGESFINDFNDLTDAIPYENQAYGPEFRAGAYVPIGRPVFDSTYQSVPYSPVKNQKRDFFNMGLTTQTNFSYSAGDDKSTFFISGQDVNSKAVMPGDKGRRDAFRVSGSKIYGRFSADFTLSYTYKYTDFTSNEASVYDNLLNTPADIPIASYKDWQNNKFADLSGYYNDYYLNPYWVVANDRSTTTDNNLTGNVHLGLKVTNWLNFSYRLSMNQLSRTNEIKNAGTTYSDFAATKSTQILYSNYAGNGIIDSTGGAKFDATQGNSLPTYQTTDYSNFLVTSDVLATINPEIGKNYSLNINLGSTYVDNRISGQSINAGPLFFPVYNVSSLTGIPGIGSGHTEARKLGYFGEATVGYKRFAFLHGSYRTDIDSRLSKSNRFIPYWDVDASLVISDMIPAFAKSDVVNFIKIRAAHSVTGNVSALGGGSQNIADGAYTTDPTLYSAAGLGFPYNGVGGYALNNIIANPNIRPETVTEDEVGLQLGFLNDRITLGGDVFQQKLKDGIVYATIPNSSGFTQALVNAANTLNKGLEADLHITPVRSKDFTWNIGVNYTHITGKVITINGSQTTLNVSPTNQNPFFNVGQNGAGTNANAFAVKGMAYPQLETYDWARDPAGQVIVDPITGLPSKATNLSILGQVNPKDIVGITSTFTYKRFTLNVTADYRGGNVIFNTLGSNLDFSGNGITSVATGRQRFVFPNSAYTTDGGKTYTKNTNITVSDANFSFWPSLYNSVGANYVTKADVWKLREVSLSYDFPKSWYAITKIVQHASFTVSGRNLLMIRPGTNKWTDPEFAEGTGNDGGRTSESQGPPTRILSATLSLQF